MIYQGSIILCLGKENTGGIIQAPNGRIPDVFLDGRSKDDQRDRF